MPSSKSSVFGNEDATGKEKEPELKGLDDSEVTHPPGATESLGPVSDVTPVAGVVVKDEKAAAERARLDRIGVVYIEGTTRGINVMPEGHHMPNPVLDPIEGQPGDALEKGEYITATGEKIPAQQLNSPTVQNPVPYPLPGTVPVPVPPVIVPVTDGGKSAKKY